MNILNSLNKKNDEIFELKNAVANIYETRNNDSTNIHGNILEQQSEFKDVSTKNKKPFILRPFKK